MLPDLLRRFRPRTFAAAAAVLLLGIAAAHPLPRPWRFAGEGTVYLLLALACASSPPLRRVAARLGWPRLVLLGTVFTVAVGVQLVKSYGPAYPFVRWTMYGSVDPRPIYPSFEASLSSGRTIPFPFAELTPSRSPRAFLASFALDLQRMHTASAAERAEGRDTERLLSQLAHLYNQRNASDPITAVRAAGCFVPIHGYRGAESVRCEYLVSFDLEPEERP